MFDGDQEVSAALGEVEEKGGSHAARRPAPAHPQVRLNPAAGAGPGSHHWHWWPRWSGRSLRL